MIGSMFPMLHTHLHLQALHARQCSGLQRRCLSRGDFAKPCL